MFVVYSVHSNGGTVRILSVHQALSDAKNDLESCVTEYCESLDSNENSFVLDQANNDQSTCIRVAHKSIESGWIYNSTKYETFELSFFIKKALRVLDKPESNKHNSIMSELKDKLSKRRKSITGND